MASLIDKLRRAQPQANRPAKPAATGCTVRVQHTPHAEFPLDTLSTHSLRLLTGLQLADLAPEDLLFLDTETTGLRGGAGTLAFLVGLGRFEGESFVVRQYLMRDYDEEPFVLQPVLEALQACGAVVTFNGASFDLPLLDSRLVMNRMPGRDTDKPHLDLLHMARRVYKLRLSRCSLSNLEAQVFGAPRTDDLPGSEVPQRYFQYLQSKDEALLEDILRHNAQDIVSLARLIYALRMLHEQPLSAQDQRDLFSLGRVMERRGEKEQAQRCYRACTQRDVRELAQLRLADMLRRQGSHGEAAHTYEALRRGGQGGPEVFIALAKLYEHRFRDPARALEITRQGMVYCLERLDGESEENRHYRDLTHRAGRLIAKLGGKTDGISG